MKFDDMPKRPEGMDDETYYKIISAHMVNFTMEAFGAKKTTLNGKTSFMFVVKSDAFITNVLAGLASHAMNLYRIMLSVQLSRYPEEESSIAAQKLLSVVIKMLEDATQAQLLGVLDGEVVIQSELVSGDELKEEMKKYEKAE